MVILLNIYQTNILKKIYIDSIESTKEAFAGIDYGLELSKDKRYEKI